MASSSGMLPSIPLNAVAQPLRLAIVGSGPSGFYAASRVLSAFKNKEQQEQHAADHDQSDLAAVHIYERLPVPNGLVRWGVAPDHLDVKNVEHKFADVARDPRFRFFGNVLVTAGDSTPENANSSDHAALSQVSRSPQGYNYPEAVRLPLDELAQYYTHVLLSYGCSQSRLLGIPGSDPGDVTNVHSALDFVNWYNGHPAAHDPDILAHEPWRRVNLDGLRQMSVIGAGNVALDVARIVLRASAVVQGQDDALRKDLMTSDIPASVLQYLSQSRITDVDINARRGPAQAAFTNKELREMMALPGVGFQGVDKLLIENAEKDVEAEEEKQRVAAKEAAQSSAQDGSGENAEALAASAGQARIRRRLLSLLEKGSKTKVSDAEKSWSLNFYRAPAAFIPASQSAGSSSGDDGTASPPPLERIRWTATSPATTKPAASSTSASHPSAVWGNEPTSSSTAQGGVATVPTDSDKASPRVPDSTFETEADLVVSSVGYKGAPLDVAAASATSSSAAVTSMNVGSAKLHVPWDATKGIIPNRNGRVVNAEGQTVSRLHCRSKS